MSESILIESATIYTEKEVIKSGFLLVHNGKIATIAKERIPIPADEGVKVIDGRHLTVIPGFIDGHIHGANGADTMDATEEALDTIASILPKEGTTSFLATTMTQSKERIEKALHNVALYEHKAAQAEVLGIHLEGPFINVNKKGAQPAAFVEKPTIELFHRWQEIARGKIKTVTIAPECDEEGLISYLKETGCNVSAGHSEASFDIIKESVGRGVDQLTHLCNAMTGVHHRDVGAVGASFLIDELHAELIADGIHTSKEMLQIIYNNVGSERLLLITDSMRAKPLEDGMYELGGQSVRVANNKATLEDGTLAGSILTMVDGVKNMLKLDGVSLRDVIKMASVNPAQQIDMYDRKGSITVGKDADILLVDNDLTIKYTICRGTIAYEE